MDVSLMQRIAVVATSTLPCALPDDGLADRYDLCTVAVLPRPLRTARGDFRSNCGEKVTLLPRNE